MNGMQAGANPVGFTAGMIQWPNMLGKQDGTWNINGSAWTYNGVTYDSAINGAPAAAIRGGDWTGGVQDGVFAYAPLFSGAWSTWSIGFRCARPR